MTGTCVTLFEKGYDRVTSWLNRVLAVALLVGISLNCFNVVGRYVAGFTLAGVDEIEIYILIWIAFLGAAVVTWRGEHLRMDVIVNMCPPAIRKAVALFEMIVLLAVSAFVAAQSFRYVERIYALGAVSDIAHVPTWVPHSAIFISFGAVALIVISQAVQAFTDPGSAARAASQSETIR